MKRIVLSAVLLGFSCGAAFAAGEQPAPAALLEVINGLADYKTFRATDAELDAVLSAHCKKTKSKKDAYGGFYDYACTPASGLKSAMVMISQHGDKPPFLLTLSVVFNIDYHAAVRKAVQDKLGKPKRSTADSAMWRYTSDKKLNENGNPIILIARDKAENVSSMDVALEQGP